MKATARLVIPAFCAVMALGVGLRLFKLGGFPNGFFRDEAALGYNAYSIWQTGRDEYGMRFPIVFRSFEVFFLPAYIYLTAPIVGLFGLTVFNVRLLSALSGITALACAWLIAGELWGNSKISFVVTLLLAIAPWHIFYSRGAFEGNLALTLFSLGFLFWLKYIKNFKGTFLLASGVFFVLSMYSYQAERLVVPLFGAVACLLVWRDIWARRVQLFVPGAVILALLIPLLLISFNAGGDYRAYNVSILSKSAVPPGWIKGVRGGLLVNNAVYLRVRQLASLYLSYFSPRNLFIDGDSNRQRAVDGFSVLYSWMFPFLVVGLVGVVRKRTSGDKLLLAWMLLGPLPAAATSDPFHTYRALLTFMPLTILSGKGLFDVIEKITRQRLLAFGIVGVVGAYTFGQFLFAYFIADSFTRAKDWDYGYRELIPFLETIKGARKIIIDDPKTTPYIQLLFFGKVNPRDYQAAASGKGVLTQYYTSAEDLRPESFDSFEFRRVNWRAERGDSGKVFVMANFLLPPSEFRGDPNVKLLKEIDYPNGETAFRIVWIR